MSVVISRRRVLAIRLATLAALLLTWQALAESGLFYKDIVPGLLQVAEALWGQVENPIFYHNLAVTGYEVAIGFAIAVVLALPFGLFTGVRAFAGKVSEPYINAFATTPKIVFLPIVMLIVGIGPASKVALGALSAFFPIVIATSAGAREMPRIWADVGRAFNASRWQIATKIYLPALVEPMITGMRFGVGVAIIGVLLGEVKLSNRGLGFMASDYYGRFDIPNLYATLILIFFLAVMVNLSLAWMGRRAVGRASGSGK